MTRLILRPSSAPRWAHCAGSHVMEAAYPEDTESPEAREGTAAHFYATEKLQGRVWPVGTLAPNGHPIDAEMVEAGDAWVEDVQAEMHRIRAVTVGHPAFGVERRLTAHALIHPDNEGTPDAYMLDLPGMLLILWDYKYGHRFHDPYEHDQCINYVAGVFEAYELTPSDTADLTVSIRIVQPRNYDRAGPVREWRTDGPTIWRHIARLRAAAAEAKGPDPQCRTGPWCRDCDAIHACDANRRVGGYSMDLASRAVPQELPLPALGLELRQIDTALQRLKARRDGLAEIAMAAVRSGQRVQGWKVEHKPGRETWTAPLPQVFALGDMLGVDLRKPAALTPTQARKAGLDADVMQGFSTRPTGKAELVPLDDTTAARVFTAPPRA